MAAQGDLWSALKSGDTNAIRKAIAEGADYNLVSPRGEYALQMAIVNDDWPSFQTLIDCGADVNLLPRGDLTPMAILKANRDKLKNYEKFEQALLAAGAKTFPSSKVQILLWNAISRRKLRLARLLQKLGGNLDEIYYETGFYGDMSLVSLAISNGNIPALNWLLDQNASVHLKDRNGHNVALNMLRYASGESFFPAVVQLLEKRKPDLFVFPNPQYDIDQILSRNDLTSSILWDLRAALETPWTTPRPIELQILCVQKASSGVARGGVVHWLGTCTPETLQATIEGLTLINAPQSVQMIDKLLGQIFPGEKITNTTDYKKYRTGISSLDDNTPCVIEFEKGSRFGHESNGYILDLAVEYIRANLTYFRMAKPAVASRETEAGK